MRRLAGSVTLCWLSIAPIGALLLSPAAANAQQSADLPNASSVASLSDTELGVQATYRFTENPARACPAAEEYVRRGLRTTKAIAIQETVLPFCKKRAGLSVPSQRALFPGRYTCLRVGFAGNQVADDLFIHANGGYEVGGGTGRYTARDSEIVFDGGPWATARSRWVGQFVPAGSGAKVPTIVIRDQRDVLAGNKRDLQWCNLAR